MPLVTGKSHADFEHNLKAEIDAGKPKAQAVAIAYSKMGEANDMSPTDWRGLVGGLVKFFTEEAEEPEHAEDEALTDSVGRKHYDRVPISKAAVNEYKGSEIPKWQELGLEADKLYRLLRDPEELAKGASTFNGIQLLQRHIPVSVDDHQPYDIVGAAGTSAEFDHPFLYNGLTVWAKAAIDAIDDDSKRELSCSYSYVADPTPGMFEGQPYDIVMRNIEANHVACVSRGRAGPDCAFDEDAVNERGWLVLERALLALTVGA